MHHLGEVLALALRDAELRDGKLLFDGQRPEDVVPLASNFEHAGGNSPLVFLTVRCDVGESPRVSPDRPTRSCARCNTARPACGSGPKARVS